MPRRQVPGDAQAQSTRRVFVDGMNVVGARADGWWRDRRGAMDRLVADLATAAPGLAGAWTIVFDGRRHARYPDAERRGIRVVFANRRGRDGADDRIVELIEAEPARAAVLVYTSDRALRARVETLGGRVAGATTLFRLLAP